MNRASKALSMTEGSILKGVVLYSLPLIFGNFMQQLYNTFDSFIVGNVIGEAALAAVGASGTISIFLIAFCLGASSGAGILISQAYGAKDYKRLKKIINSMMGVGLVFGIFISIVGMVLCNWFLRILSTPEDIIQQAVTYLRIYFCGMIFQVMYNMLSGILNAVGNSRRSLMYLAAASVLNILLDILLIRFLHMGVAGAAIATVISQAFSCIAALTYLVRTNAEYRVVLKEIALEKEYVKGIIRIGLPTAIQSAVISISTLFILSGVNGFGTNAAAGFTAYMKVDGFNVLPIMSFSLAATTFVGQNIGAGNPKRALRGVVYIGLLNILYTVVMTIIMLTFDRHLIGFFSQEEEVIRSGVMCIHSLAPYYCLLATVHTFAGGLRGTGNTMAPMAIILITFCAVRILWINIAAPYFPDIRGVYYAYPVSFSLGTITMILYSLFHFKPWVKRKQA